MKYRIIIISLLTIFMVSCGDSNKIDTHLDKAQQFYTEGNYANARTEYEQALQLDPENLKVRYQFAQVLEKLQDFRAAAGQYNAILEQDETNIKARVRLGQYMLLAKKYDQAMEQAETALKHAPDNADVLAFRGSIFMKQNHNESAMRDAIRALQSDPDNINAVLLKASLMSQNGNVNESIELLNATLVKNPENILLRNTLASVYINAGENDKAIEQVNKMVQQQPDVLFHRLRLADVYFSSGNKRLAEETMRKAIEDFPDNIQIKLSLIKYIARADGDEAAINETQKFINAQPQIYILQFTLAKMYQGLGQSDNAVRIYRDVIAKEELKPDGLTARILLAELFAKTGRNNEAKSLLVEVLKESPNNQTALTLRGQVSLSENDAVSAIADFQSAMRDQPDSALLFRNLSRAHMVNNEMDLAIDNMKRAVNLNENDLGLREEYIRVLAMNGDTEGVINQLNKILEISPDNLGAMEALFRVHAARKDWDKLKQITDRMKMTHPDKALGFYYSGMLLREQKQEQESISEFEHAVELAPNAIEPVTQLVRTFMVLNQPEKALEKLNEILSANESNVFARNLIGEVHIFNQELDKAIESFEQAISMKPDWQLPYRNLANSYLLKKENDNAIKAYERGIDATGFSPLLVTDLARYFEASGNVNEAIKLYEEVLVQDENNNLASNNLAMLLIDYRGDDQSLNRASVLVEHLKDINNPAYQDTIGWLLYKQDKVREAIPYLEKAMAASPDNIGFNYHLGMAYFKDGNKEAARQPLTIATDTDRKYLGIEEARKTLESL